ncbi:MAG TPA: type II toxin-antitoxin system VapC family toxin [Beutenbergiaceae bacterium]|nr:type II toxin-antitoxin system VapC family toxin [Beutenbergiaceae bacterium]
MILPDVNILVYAFNTDSPHHETYRPWLGSVLTETEEFAVTDLLLSGFVRIVTNPRIFARPEPTSTALQFVAGILAAPRTRWLTSTSEVWNEFNRLCADDQGIRGNLVPDAYLAALAIAHGARLATTDRGFARFPGLQWFDPAT